MARSLIPDPLEFLREAVNRLEGGANSLANRRLANSQQLAKTLTQFATLSIGAQRVLEKALAGVFAKLDIPSRAELAELSAAVQRIEDKLDLLLPASAKASAAPRPARTRRPPAAQASSDTTAAKKAPSRPAARGGKGAAR